MNAQKQPGDVISQKTRSWDNLRLADLVKTVAKENGLVPKVAAELADIHIDHVDGGRIGRQSADALARTWNAVSKPSGGYWLFLRQGATANASGEQTAALIITPEEVSNWFYSEGERGSSTGKATASSGKSSGKIGVRYYDEADGKTKTTTVDHDGPSMANPYTQPVKATADQQAKAKKRRPAAMNKK